MTYCVGVKVNQGIVFMGDTRTNAGLDSVSTFRKLYEWHIPNDRTLVLMNAGNLATSQSVIGYINEQISLQGDLSIALAKNMFQVAQIIGILLKKIIINNTSTFKGKESSLAASFILGGQIKGEKPRLFNIYSEGNFIESTSDTPFFQVGEHKYGRPILIRAYDAKMSFDDLVKLMIVSFDSTIKSNWSVGMPVDMMIYKTDSFKKCYYTRFEEDDKYFNHICHSWSNLVRESFEQLEPFSFDEASQNSLKPATEGL